MFLLYIDESGNEADPRDRHFVLGGAAVFERQTFFLSRDIDTVQTQHFPGLQPIEFHTAHIRQGKGFWRDVPLETKNQVLRDVANAIAGAVQGGLVLFAAVIEKSDQLWGERAVEHATEQVCNRFDIFLQRRYHDANDPQRGLLLFSQGRFDDRARIWVREFRELGNRWGVLRNLSDIPYFGASRETRLLQVADYVAHSIFLLFERRNADLVRPILHRFDQQDGVIHGLVHVRSDPRIPCDCPACYSRRNPGQVGPWVA